MFTNKYFTRFDHVISDMSVMQTAMLGTYTTLAKARNIVMGMSNL